MNAPRLGVIGPGNMGSARARTVQTVELPMDAGVHAGWLQKLAAGSRHQTVDPAAKPATDFSQSFC